MHAGFIIRKQTSHGIIIKTIIACSLSIALLSCFFSLVAPYIEAAIVQQAVVPLLLNSGEVHTKEAEVSIILWFENGNIPDQTRTTRPTLDWEWTYNHLNTGSKKDVATLSGHRLINKIEERDLYKWYTIMEQELAKTGGMIYIDERVDQAMDISSYLSKTNAIPAQWASTDNMVSIAAYQTNFSTSVIAGQDRINIQLLSRGKNTEGRSVLAIPALLKEF